MRAQSPKIVGSGRTHRQTGGTTSLLCCFVEKKKNPTTAGQRRTPNAIYNCNNCEKTQVAQTFSPADGDSHCLSQSKSQHLLPCPPMTCVNISAHQKALVADFNAIFHCSNFLRPDCAIVPPSTILNNLITESQPLAE